MHYVIFMFKYLQVSTFPTGPPLTICIMLYTRSNISRLVPSDCTTPDYMHYVIHISIISRLVPFDWATPDYMHYVIYMFKYLAVSTFRLDLPCLYTLCYIHVQISLGQYLSTGPHLSICIMLYTCSNISRFVTFDWTTPDYMHYVIYMFKYLQVSTFRLDQH